MSNGDTALLNLSGIASANNGTINVSSGATLDLALGENLSTGLINNTGGTVILDGTYHNGGQVLDFSKLGNIGPWLFEGTIEGGTVKNLNDHITGEAILKGVTADGTINLAQYAELETEQALTMAGADGVGTIDASSHNQINCLFSQTLSNAVINLGNGSKIFSNDLANTRPTTLTLESSVTVNQTGLSATIASSDQSTDLVVNEGTINALFAGGTFEIQGFFRNNGTIAVGDGDTLSLQAQTSGHGTIALSSGGTVSIGAFGVAGVKFDFQKQTNESLLITSPSTFTSPIENFVAGDTIDVDGATSAVMTSKQAVTLYDGATAIGTLRFAGGLDGASLSVTSVAGGIDIGLADPSVTLPSGSTEINLDPTGLLLASQSVTPGLLEPAVSITYASGGFAAGPADPSLAGSGISLVQAMATFGADSSGGLAIASVAPAPPPAPIVLAAPSHAA